MRKVLVAALFLLVSSAAHALPAPSEIEAAVNAGHLAQAEGMVREVIREKPASAKAHYELGQILARQGRSAEARQELLEAQRLDPTLKFASDPRHFRDLVNRLPGDASGTTPPRAVAAERPAAAASVPAALLHPGLYVLAGVVVLLVVWRLIARPRTAAQVPPPGATGALGSASGGYPPPPGPAPGPTSGVGGSLLGGAAGLAAGYGLAKLLEDKEGGPVGHAANEHPLARDPVEAPPPDVGSFDAGAGGDTWDGGSSGGDDSW